MTRRSAWTPEEFRHYLATGQEPEDTPTPAPVPAIAPSLSPTANKYGARKSWRDGIRFDSEVEAERYDHHKNDPGVLWVDVHPVLTLAAGIRFRADFLVHYRDGRRQLEDVKGARPGTDFWRLKALVDAEHPLRPLLVVRRRKGRWITVRERRDWAESKSAPCAPDGAEGRL